VFVKALDKLVVIVGSVIADEVVELWCYFKAIEGFKDNSSLRSACIIAVEVLKREEYITLSILSV
jgi:hypothetical protein